jgi:thiamine biosynthesis protein ThiS
MKIKLNGKDTETTEGNRIADLLKMHALLGTPLVVELNGSIIKSGHYNDIRLSEGDVLEIVRLVGGG